MRRPQFGDQSSEKLVMVFRRQLEDVLDVHCPEAEELAADILGRGRRELIPEWASGHIVDSEDRPAEYVLLELFEVAVRELGRLEGLWEAEASPEERRRARLPKVSVGLIGGGGNPNLAVPVVLRTLREQAENRPEYAALLDRLRLAGLEDHASTLDLTRDEQSALCRAVVIALEDASGSDERDLGALNMRLHSAQPTPPPSIFPPRRPRSKGR